MDFSSNSLRSVEMWRIWKAHNLIEQMQENFEIGFENGLNETTRRWSLYRLIN